MEEESGSALPTDTSPLGLIKHRMTVEALWL